VPLGRRALRGVAEEIELFAAKSGRAATGEKRRDPVCGMELAESEVGASLTTGGNEHAFCSDECLRRFVAAPEKYTGAEA
jgi:Cu+-exporting ATPase